MIWLLSLLLVAAPVDPRPALVELELADQPEIALAATERAIAGDPAAARRWGLDYLRGHLLEQLCRHREAAEAFAAAMGVAPDLMPYGRYRLARAQAELGHPEVAAGLAATLLANAPPTPLIEPASRLLAVSLQRGGDCRLLGGIRFERLPAAARRRLTLARAACARRDEALVAETQDLMALLGEAIDDDVARAAAERLAELPIAAAEAQTLRLLGVAFHEHREFDRAVTFLSRSLEVAGGGDLREATESEYLIARSLFWLGQWETAARRFTSLAARVTEPHRQAAALFQAGRCQELAGAWPAARRSFRAAHDAAPHGEWAGTALLAALRLEWRGGEETAALGALARLAARPAFAEAHRRALLFLAASDLVQGRADRATGFLGAIRGRGPDEVLELDYWRGRAAEVNGRPGSAIEAYLAVLRRAPGHLLADAARRRLAGPALALSARAHGGALASRTPPDWLGAWLLWSGLDPRAEAARQALVAQLAADPRRRGWVRIEAVPPAAWPLFRSPSPRPETRLLALGLWREGAPAVPSSFPAVRLDLALTAGQQLARAGEVRRAVALAESAAQRLPPDLPLPLAAPELLIWLYPRPFGGLLDRESARQQVDPSLLAALIREESRFDPLAYSAASARGLTQFVFPTARRLAGQLRLGEIAPEDLERPDLAIALGAAYVAELTRLFDGRELPAIAAYNAGEAQAGLWQRHCFGVEPAEYFTKIGFKETRAYVARVLQSRGYYRGLYALPAALAPTPNAEASRAP